MTHEIYIKKYGEAAGFMLRRKRNGILGTPWGNAIGNIRHRCNNPNDKKFKYYGGMGIKCLVSVKELKELFYRDMAWDMKFPTVDRIHPDGNYEKNNIRWIEFSENRKNRRINVRRRTKTRLETSNINISRSLMDKIRNVTKNGGYIIRRRIEIYLIAGMRALGDMK